MSLMSSLVPLAMLFIVLAILGLAAIAIYNIVMDVKKATKKKMEKNNVTWSRDGVTVEVKELNDEEYKDRTQSVLVDVWNHGAPPDMNRRR
ncbi:predicted protein [Uncinocarpus reesii 1704]|uniref:Uncharacterized protein n=1 Tax=Uncinocarpus reesii (strain UAMH 1704) TaxID=336963 RepID=C4JK34_UNCRE|nr:uncharacterized protein UREG_01991 [Uncinocarpus reesii 1704]EEP77142.1 predicted protein [Uncinocarpus reesii 1704]